MPDEPVDAVVTLPAQRIPTMLIGEKTSRGRPRAGSLTVDVVVPLCGDLERHFELEVGDRTGVAVEVDHLAEVGYDLVRVDRVNQRLDRCQLLDAAHVEPVNVVPPVNLRAEIWP